MTRPGEAIQVIQVGHHPSSERDEVDIANKFKKVRVLIAHQRFIPVLEEVSRAVMAEIEGNGIAGQKPAHECGERSSGRSEQEMEVI